MGWVVLVLVVAALAGGVVWNHRTAAAAMEGVQFQVVGSPDEVAGALRAAYCEGARAGVRSVLSRMTVTPVGLRSFSTASSMGDSGEIDVSGDGTMCTVTARTTGLYVGTPPALHLRSGLMGFSARIVHGAYKALGIAPNAGKMKRFHAGVERRVGGQLRRQAAA